MNVWLILAAYEATWFVSVAGAGRGHGEWGVLAVLAFGAWRCWASPSRGVDLRLAAVALLLGALLESSWTGSGLLHYAAPWPWPAMPPWLMGLWVAFAFTIVPLFGYLHARPWLAAALGALGGPLAYLGAARGWHALTMSTPLWRPLLALALGWAIATPLLTSLARHWLRQALPRVAA